MSALKKIFDFNVMKFADGSMGAVNGMAADGTLITLPDNQQVREVWAGTTLGLAGLMLSEGMKDQAYRTAWGVLPYDLRDQGLLVPHTRSLGHHRRLSRLDVYASGRDLDDGNDAEERSGFDCAQERTNPDLVLRESGKSRQNCKKTPETIW